MNAPPPPQQPERVQRPPRALPFPPLPEVIDLSDLGPQAPRSRATHFVVRALVADSGPVMTAEGYRAAGIWREELYVMYQAAVMNAGAAAGQGGRETLDSLLSAADFLDIVAKLFKGAATLDESGEFVQGIKWKRPLWVSVEDCEAMIRDCNALDLESAAQLPAPAPASTSAPTSTSTVAIEQHYLDPFDDGLDDYNLVNLRLPPLTLADGRKLSHLAEPLRTKTWLKMYYRLGSNVEMSCAAMWSHYERTFCIFDRDPTKDSHLSDTDLAAQIQKIFPVTEETHVGPETFVIWRLQPRLPPRRAEDVLRSLERKQAGRTRRRLERMEAKGETVPRLRLEDSRGLNRFQEKLLVGPLLPLPLNQPGPVTRRLRLRGQKAAEQNVQEGSGGVEMKLVEEGSDWLDMKGVQKGPEGPGETAVVQVEKKSLKGKQGSEVLRRGTAAAMRGKRQVPAVAAGPRSAGKVVYKQAMVEDVGEADEASVEGSVD